LEPVEEPSPELRVPFAQSGAFVCKFIIGEPNDRAVCLVHQGLTR
jgi:hypothetical protein